MTNLIASEKYKFVRSKALYVTLVGLLVVVVGFLTGSVYSYFVYGEMGAPGYQGIYTPTALDILLVLWFPVFIAYFAGMEFQNKTVNNALCLGKSRLAVYLAKLLAIFAGVAAMTLLVVTVTTIVQSVVFGFGAMTISEYLPYFLRIVGLQLIFLCAVASLFTMLAFIAQTPLMTMALGIGYIIFSSALQQMVAVLFDGQLAFIREWFPSYYQVALAMQGLHGGDPAPVLRGIAVSFIWAVVTTFVGVSVFKKKDLK